MDIPADSRGRRRQRRHLVRAAGDRLGFRNVGNRLEAVIIAGAVITVSAAIGVTLWAGLGLAWPFALIAGAATLVIQLFVAVRSGRLSSSSSALYGAQPPVASRAARPAAASSPAILASPSPDTEALQQRLEAVEAGLRTVAQRIWQIDQRVSELDRQVIERSRSTVQAVATELDMVGSVVRELAEAVALHDAELFAGPAQPSRRPASEPVLQATRAEPVNSAAPPVEPPSARLNGAPVGAPPAPEPAAPAAEDPTPVVAEPPRPRETSQAVRRAVLTGTGVDLFLQSVVTLPQRKVKLYEALPRVREPDGGFSEGDEVAEVAARHGVAPAYDATVLRQVAKVIRHLAARDRDVPVLCPVNIASLPDRDFFDVLSDIASEGPSISGRLLLRLRADQVAAATPVQFEAMDAVKSLGLRFVLDRLSDLRLDAHGLGRRGFRYVKVTAPLLLAGEHAASAEIHPADLAGFLTRQGITMVVCDVADEDTALEVMDYEATLGQGDAFAGPRPVRQEVIEQDPPKHALAPPPPQATAAAAAPAGPRPAIPAGLAAGQVQRPAPSGAVAAAGEPGASPQRASLRSFLRRTTA